MAGVSFTLKGVYFVRLILTGSADEVEKTRVLFGRGPEADQIL